MLSIANLRLPEEVDRDKAMAVIVNWPADFADDFNWSQPLGLKIAREKISPGDWKNNLSRTQVWCWSLSDDHEMLTEQHQTNADAPDEKPHFAHDVYMHVGGGYYLLTAPVVDGLDVAVPKFHRQAHLMLRQVAE